MWFRPHYVRDYRRMVRTLVQNDPSTAMERAVGSGYVDVGTRQAKLLREIGGLRDGHLLVDIGCGSGRTAFALKDMPIRYHGTDVVPELIDYARQKAERPDWRFTIVESLTVPEESNVADVIAMFSVVTHLTASEGERYVTDAARVLKPGGALVVSFLDPQIAFHRKAAAGGWLFQFKERMRGRSVMNSIMEPRLIQEWAQRLGLRVQLFGPEHIGQSFAVLRK